LPSKKKKKKKRWWRKRAFAELPAQCAVRAPGILSDGGMNFAPATVFTRQRTSGAAFACPAGRRHSVRCGGGAHARGCSAGFSTDAAICGRPSIARGSPPYCLSLYRLFPINERVQPFRTTPAVGVGRTLRLGLNGSHRTGFARHSSRRHIAIWFTRRRSNSVSSRR